MTTTDPSMAQRSPQIQQVQCGNTQIHQCVTGASAGSNSAPMYIDTASTARNTSTHDQQSRTLIQQSAGSPAQHFNISDHYEADAVRTDSSSLSQSPAPSYPPPTHLGPTPTVPAPPTLSANSQHRRNARAGKGLGQACRGEAGRDPLQEKDPWRYKHPGWGREGRHGDSQNWDSWTGEGHEGDAWEQYRTPVNSGMNSALLSNLHPDHGNTRMLETPTFSPFKPLNTDQRAAWRGPDAAFDIPKFPGSSCIPNSDTSHNPFAQTFAPCDLPAQQCFPRPLLATLLEQCQPCANQSEPQLFPNMQSQTYPASHPYAQCASSCCVEPGFSGNGNSSWNGNANPGHETMMQHMQRLQETWLKEQAAQHQERSCQSYAQQLASTTWTPNTMNADMPEFLPSSMPNQMPIAPNVFPSTPVPNSTLLGPLLPGYRLPIHDSSRVQEFLPSYDVGPMQGSGQLPGAMQSHQSCSQSFNALGARDQPFSLSDLFTEETLPGLRTSGVGRWGAEVEDEQWHTPIPTTSCHAVPQNYTVPGRAPPPPPPPPGPWTNPFAHGPGAPQFPSTPVTPIVPNMTRYHTQTPSACITRAQAYQQQATAPPQHNPMIGAGGDDFGAGGGYGQGGGGGPPYRGPGYAGGGGGGGPPPGGPGCGGGMPLGGFVPGGGPPPGPGGAGMAGARLPPKRWLPPPAWTPGVTGGLTYRQWLWQLSGWAKLTAMSHEDRGVAVALSLGGRAARIAQTLSHATLSQPNGLHLLLTKIELDLGAEMQDRVRTCAREFKRFVRPRGMSASEFVVEFERRYTEAHAHGLHMSTTLLTLALLEQAQLSESQESWILQCVAGDLTQYDAVRRAMRRVPNLDHRHQDASAWQLQHDDDSADNIDFQTPNHRPARPFYDGGLNVPPAEQLPPSSSQHNSLVENQPDYFPTFNEDDSDSDDDYCSTCPSCEDQETCENLNQAFAIIRHRRAHTRKTNGKKHYRRGFRRPRSAWVLDKTRNADDNTIPPGWDAKRWLSRTKCPGCGSRWHRNCQGQGKTYAIMRKKPGHKKSWKPAGQGGNGSSGHGGGSSGQGGSSSSGARGGRGGHSFGVFLTTMAAVLSSAQSVLMPQPYTPQLPTISHTDVRGDMFSITNDFRNLNCFENENCREFFHEIPPSMPYTDTVFHAYHMNEFLAKTEHAVVGLEPLDKDWREKNYAAFAPSAKMRFAILMDTGAPQSAAGEEWLSRYIHEHELEKSTTTIPFTAKLSGIGEGSASVRVKKVVPTGMYDVHGELFVGRWEAQQLEGIGKLVPPLCGFESMCNRKMIISMQNPTKPILNCIAGDSRTDFELIRHHGHILLPIDWGGAPLPTKEKYLSDPLGLNVWFGNESTSEPCEEKCAQPPQSFEIVFDSNPYPHPSDTDQSPNYSTAPPQTFTLQYHQPPYPDPALSQFAHTTNNTESSSLPGPDDPLPEVVTMSSVVCPTTEISDNDHLAHPPGLTANTNSQTNITEHLTLSTEELQTNASHTTLNAKSHAAMHATDTVQTAHSAMYQTHAAAHATNTVAHGKTYVGKQLTQKFESLPKEKRSGSQHKFPQNFTNIDNDDIQHNTTNITGATYGMVKQLRLSTRQQQHLAKSATYQRKYRPLPPLTPVPPLDNIAKGQWDLWEWWAGTGNMTKTAHVDCQLVCGPPVTRETGWELSLPHHQLALLHLLDTHKPLILYAGPTCAPWSQANTTMEPELKALVRQLEENVFSFYASACRKQVREGRDYVFEQPRNSALLKTSTAVSLAADTKSVDQYLCMCMHNLVSPSSGLAHMKPSILRGTVLFTERTLQWCDHQHEHEPLNGRAPGGGLKTSYAQQYTRTFCKRCCRDMRAFLKSKHSDMYAFPLEDTEVVEVTEDPYQLGADDQSVPRTPTLIPVPLEERPRLLPTPKRIPQRPQPASSSNQNPFRELSDQWDEELKDAVNAGNRAADELQDKRQPAEEPGRPRQKSEKQSVVVSDLIPAQPSDALEVAVPDLVVNRTLPVPVENEKCLHDMRIVYTQRISSGVTATIQAGQRMRLLQELFGTPSGVQVLAAVIAKHPNSTVPPEPVISRTSAPLLKEVYLQKDKGKWQQTTWIKYSTTHYGKRPFWVIYLYGIMKAKDEILVNPFQELAELQQDALKPLQSLPRFLKAIVEGTSEERTALIIGLHKRLYHRSSTELKKMLHQAGVPLHILAFVDDAVAACETCRAYANTAARPLAKLSTAPVFNDTVYYDLVFFSNVILFIAVDESIRYMVLAPVEYKSYDSLETAYRRHWVAHFGPPRRFRSDRESVFNSDKFATYLSSQGTALELITAGDQHTWLGILDRRVQLVRKMYPKLLRDLSNENLCVDHEDAAAECMIAVNTQSTYGGTCPYVMLYGTLPSPLFPEDSEHIVPISAHTIFYEHQLIRSKAIASFHAAVIEERLERVLAGRSRNTANQQKYLVGMHVDFFRKSEKKQLEGWRGPATILALLGEGYVTLRWQSHTLDIPVNHVRPHINVTPTVAAPAPQPKESVVNASSDTAAGPLAVVDDQTHTALVAWENYWFTEANNTVMDDAFLSLVSCTALMPLNTTIVHGLYTKDNVVLPSAAAARDSGVLFSLGKDAAHARGISNYIGVVLIAGKRFTMQSTAKAYHCYWWTGDATTATLHEAIVTHQVDFISLGVKLVELSQLRAVVFLEGEAPSGPPLHELLRFAELEPPSSEGRVRNPTLDISNHATVGTSTRSAQLPSLDPDNSTIGVDNLGTTRAPTEIRSEFDDTINAAIDSDETWIAISRCRNLKNHSFYEHQVPEELDSALMPIDKTASNNTLEHEFCFMDNEQSCGYFPLEKDTRPLTPEELISEAPAVETARLKELKSWVEHHTGVPVRKTEYERRTGLRGLASRWLSEWKRKEGVLVIKMRLVLKGFMEQNQKSLQTTSPTATRTGHRIVTQTSADQAWDIEGLDISTAFLQGFSFDKLPPGIKRQPCAFVPPDGTFALLATLSTEWKEAAANPNEFLFELHKSVYGLKDAPLMWFIAINDFLKSYGLTNCSHDQCLYKLHRDGKLVLLLSLHVDDTLTTGQKAELNKLHSALEARFGKVKRETNCFRHFGVDVYRHVDTNHITCSQTAYLDQLKPIQIARKRGDGRTADTLATTEEITLYRSLVSAIAWLGVTYPPALAAASLYQGFLPAPNIQNVLHLNACLQQFRDQYQPLIYRHGMTNPKLVVVPDSSLGNNTKYSQGGYVILLAGESDDLVCGSCSIIGFKSAKSKRVASSTLHAETLALVAACEEAAMIQTFLYEVQHPAATSLDMINVESSKLIPMIGLVDCHDLLDTLCRPTMPVLTNKAMTLYTAVLREFADNGKVGHWGWIDTRDNPANCLTKLQPDGTLDLGPLTDLLRCAAWEPRFPYRWGLQLCDPRKTSFDQMPAPPDDAFKNKEVPSTAANKFADQHGKTVSFAT